MKKKWCSKEQKNPCRGLGEDMRETETEKDGDRGDDSFAACRGGHVQAVRRLSGDGGDNVKGARGVGVAEFGEEVNAVGEVEVG